MIETYADYLFLIPPPDDVIKEIARYKRASAGIIGQYESMNSPAHISICTQQRCKPFLVKPALERMEARVNTMPPIELNINGFTYFNHGNVSYTIYANVETDIKVSNWFKLLFKQMQLKRSSFTPHITVVRNIPVASFRKLWPNFERRELGFKIQANHMLIRQTPHYAGLGEARDYKRIYFLNKIGKVAEVSEHKLF